MRAVSGTSGAAPVWRDVMMALHAHQPGHAPPVVPGLEQRRIAFQGNIEGPRSEWFLRGTGQAAQIQSPESARRPRIVSPVSGSVYAIDPDIPMDRQKIVATVTGVSTGHRLLLDRRDLGDASAGVAFLAGPGAHRLALVDPVGRVIDQARFTVR